MAQLASKTSQRDTKGGPPGAPYATFEAPFLCCYAIIIILMRFAEFLWVFHEFSVKMHNCSRKPDKNA